jgi:hypothetical protein
MASKSLAVRVATMTEGEWLACTNPQPMLDYLRDEIGDRKLRLFICACVRRVWRQLENEISQRAVEIAEHYADGGATTEELRAAFFAALDAADLEILEPTVFNSRSAAMIAATPHPNIGDAESAGWYTARAEPLHCSSGQRARLLRDLIPSPFRSVTIDPRWLSPNVVALAGKIYDDRTFDHLPILADALEEAGCSNSDILNHCRQSGEHVPGCWVVDLILGKE